MDMPNTKAYTSSHQAFWAENEQTCMTFLCFNCDQITAAKGLAYRIVPTASKGTAFIKCEQELHWPMWGYNEGKDSAQQLNDSPCKESDKEEGLLHSDLAILLTGF